MPKDLLTQVYSDLRVRQRKERRNRKRVQIITDRAEFTDSIVAVAYADLPTDGLGDSVNFVTIYFITDGRKSGEGAGAGTGVFAYWDAITSQWKTMHDYTVVLT